MKSVLITGANKNIGFETARQLLKQGFFVYLGSRNLENGLKAVEQLKSEGFNVESVQIDVTKDESVKSARVEIGKRTNVLDVLINNAGVYGVASESQNPLEVAIDNFKYVFETNIYGVVRTHAGIYRFVTKINRTQNCKCKF